MTLSMQPPSIRQDLPELTLLYQISQRLDSSMDMRDVISPVLQALADHLGLINGMLTLHDRNTGEISIETAHGLSESQKERGTYQPGEGVIGKVFQSGKAVVVPQISSDPNFLNRTGVRSKPQRQDSAFLCVPIKIGRTVIGTLSADRAQAEESDELDDTLRIMRIVASMIAQAVKLRQSAMEERHKLLVENERLQSQLKERFKPTNIIGNSDAMQSVYDQIAQVCKSNATVFISGESGTGKELISQAIHYNSNRAGKPYIKVNCAALPESVLESELFGHEKGAFTGAISQRKGRFELADGGTIFLDEIGEVSMDLQVKLLRVIQEKEFERVGGMKTVKVDVRLVTATNRNLEEMVKEGSFREDLFYRLNVFPIHLPPLRERRTDITLLADHFIDKYSQESGKEIARISSPAIDMLMSYHWPGNVRELENCVERAVIVANDRVIEAHHLPATLQTAEASNTVVTSSLDQTLDNVERNLIIETLKQNRGNLTKTAKQLGITKRVMGLRAEKHGINYKEYRKKAL